MLPMSMKRRLLLLPFLTAALTVAVFAAGERISHAQSIIDAAPSVSIPVPEKPLSPVGDIVEGYARPDYRDMMQTIVVLGGFDITDPQVADEYARLLECDSYRKHYTDDFSWDAIRRQVTDRVREKKENYRVHYEYSGIVKLDRYDFVKQMFPLTEDTRFSNVGRMEVISAAVAWPYLCRSKKEDKKDPYFPIQIGLTLNMPLDLKGLAMPPERAEALLAKLKSRGVIDRSIFVRFRFKVVDQPRIVKAKKGRKSRADLVGNLEHIDFFLDRDLTEWLASAPIVR